MSSQLGGVLVAISLIVSATVAVALDAIDGTTYVALIGPLVGAGIGAGAVLTKVGKNGAGGA